MLLLKCVNVDKFFCYFVFGRSSLSCCFSMFSPQYFVCRGFSILPVVLWGTLLSRFMSWSINRWAIGWRVCQRFVRLIFWGNKCQGRFLLLLVFFRLFFGFFQGPG